MMIAMSLAVAWNKPPVWFMDIAGGGLGGWNATAALGPLVRDQGAAALTLYQGFGLLPMFGKNGSCHNRCLPQLADLNAHLAKVADDLNDSTGPYYVPTNFSGVVTVDYEAWSPYWDEAPPAYHDSSIALQRNVTPGLNNTELEVLARDAFQSAGLNFFMRTVQTMRALRPAAKIGFYPYPQLRLDWGTTRVAAMTAFMMPLYRELGSFTPSIYTLLRSGVETTAARNSQSAALPVFMSAMLAQQIAAETGRPPALVAPFAWYRYHDGWPESGHFLSDDDFEMSFVEPFRVGADAVLVWGYEPSDANKSDAIAYLEAHRDSFNGTV